MPLFKLHGPASARAFKRWQVFFYAAFVFLWFKDNYPTLKTIPVPAWIPLLGFLAITALRTAARWTDASRPKPRIRPTRDWAIIALIIIIAAAVHAPYLAHSSGLMDSDEAIPSLQGKHIAEGKTPTVFYYGARFQGSLPQHLYALFFAFFGYSVLLTKLVAFLAYAAFLAVQYLLLKRIFSRGFALAAGLFYVLPFYNLILASFDVGSGFAVVFLLGGLIFTLTQRVCSEGRDDLLPALGFVLGLTFWTHQITVIFVLTSSLFLLLRYRFRLRAYARLALYFGLGFLPALISELYWGFPIVRMLFEGKSTGTLSGSKFANGAQLALSLFTSGPKTATIIYLLLLALGTVLIAGRALKGKRIGSAALFPVYAVVYTGVYFFSSFSGNQIIRYLFIVYLVLPVLFAGAFLWIRSERVRTAATAAFILVLFGVSQAGTSWEHYKSVVEHDADIRKVLAAVAETGEAYWKGNYWHSYTLTAVSREKVICASTTVERYPYYQLLYDTEASGANRIFLRDTPKQLEKAVEFTEILRRLGKSFKTKEIGDWLLVWGVRGEVYDKNIFFPPDEVPEMAYAGAVAEPSGLVLRFASKAPLPTGGYRINVEIPGFCTAFTPVDSGSAFVVRIPYPPDRRVRLRYHLDHQGLILDSTERSVDADLPEPPPGAARPDIEPLLGFGPHEQATGNNWRVLDRDVAFRVNRPLDGKLKITLSLFSPFLFSDIWWHGDFAQSVEILVGGKPYAGRTLKDGFNTLTVEGAFPPGPDGGTTINLKFRYRMTVSLARDHWKTAAYLDGLKLD